MESTGNLVGCAVELAAGVEGGHHGFQAGHAGIRMNVNGDAASVVGDADRAIGCDADVDAVAVPGQSLVHCIIQQLFDEMMEAIHSGAADVHSGRTRTASSPFNT